VGAVGGGGGMWRGGARSRLRSTLPRLCACACQWASARGKNLVKGGGWGVLGLGTRVEGKKKEMRPRVTASSRAASPSLVSAAAVVQA